MGDSKYANYGFLFDFGGINLIYLPLSNFYPFFTAVSISLHFFNFSFFNFGTKVVGLLAFLHRAAFFDLIMEGRVAGCSHY